MSQDLDESFELSEEQKLEQEIKGLDAFKSQPEEQKKDEEEKKEEKKEEEEIEEMPARFLCPITQEEMLDPVMDLHGHNFEKSNILLWLNKRQVCPVTNVAIDRNQLFPNLALKEEIHDWIKKHPKSAEQFINHSCLLKSQKEVKQTTHPMILSLQKSIALYKIQLSDLFHKYDVKNTGVLDKQEFFVLLKVMDQQIQPHHMEEVFQLFDIAGNKLIDFYEFQKALTPKEKVSEPKCIKCKTFLEYTKDPYRNRGVGWQCSLCHINQPIGSFAWHCKGDKFDVCSLCLIDFDKKVEKKTTNIQEWKCSQCTFMNKQSTQICEMCNTGKRPSNEQQHIKPKCGRCPKNLEYTKDPYRYRGVGWYCTLCLKSQTKDSFSWHCKDHGFDVCIQCAEVYTQMRHKQNACGQCRKPLLFLKDPYRDSQGCGWKCSYCKASQFKGTFSWHCNNDNFDICFKCLKGLCYNESRIQQ